MPVPKVRSPKFAVHTSRWLRLKAGDSIEKIAEVDKVRPETVRGSIMLIEEQKHLYSMGSLETSQVEMIIDLQKIEHDSWKESLQARNREFHDTPNGTVVVEEVDHETRLATSSQITARIAALQRKGGGITVNAQATASAAASSSVDGKTSFESKLREIIQRRKEQKKEPAVIDVPALPAGEDDHDDIE